MVWADGFVREVKGQSLATTTANAAVSRVVSGYSTDVILTFRFTVPLLLRGV